MVATQHDLDVMNEIVRNRSDVFSVNGRVYSLFWQTALDGKTWCRVKVYEPKRDRRYMYGLYFRTKKAARINIAWNQLPTDKSVGL